MPAKHPRVRSTNRFITDQLPTPFELAQIAALLSKSSDKDNAELVEQAFGLWEASVAHLNGELLREAMQQPGLVVKSVSEVPKSFDAALKEWMPKLRTKGDRYAVFRQFLNDLIAHRKEQEPSDSTSSGTSSADNTAALSKLRVMCADKAFGEAKRLGFGFGTCAEYLNWRNGFSVWFENFKFKKASQQRSVAAKARWSRPVVLSKGEQKAH